MNHLSLFSGSGIGTLAALQAGIVTVAHAENDPACCYCLERLWPGVRLFRDVRDVTAESVADLGPIDICSGGFPCQPFSTAGAQKGIYDERWKWPEFARIVGELRPRWVVAENVPGIIRKAADRVRTDLEGLGYTVRIFNLPAYAFGVRHWRKRIWFVADAIGDGLSRLSVQNHEAIQWRHAAVESLAIPAWARGLGTLADVPRHDDGMAGGLLPKPRTNLLRMVGNGWCYTNALLMFRAIVELDRQIRLDA